MLGLKGELPPLVNPDVAHDYVYVENVIEAYLLSATQPNQKLGAVYNVGTGVQTSLSQVVEIARRVMNITVEPVWETMSNRKWDINVSVADNRKIRAELGWQQRHTFEQGFRLMVNWFHANPSMSNFYQLHRQVPHEADCQRNE
jgi:nucleoside-diphosphate-sugar epimerase